jgi:type I restriction enzyme S subunit
MSSWNKIKLGNVCQISKGQQFNKIDLEKSGNFPCVNGGINPSGYTDKWNTEANTITISEGGNSCGFVNFLRTRFWSGGHCYSLLCLKDNIDVNFLYQALKGRESLIMGLRVGSGLPNIQQKAINEFEFEYPEDKSEQIRITQILSKSDSAIAKTEALIAKYQRIKKGLMQDLLTNGIDEYGTIRNEKTHRFKTEKGIFVPDEWEVVELESICQKIADRDHTTPKYVPDGVFIVSPKDFNDFHEIDFSNCQRITLEAHLINRRKTNIETEDLIFTRIGAGLGKICKVTSEMPEFSILHSACMLKPNQSKILSDFLMYHIKTEFAQKQIVDGIQSIGVPDLGMDKIRTFLVKKPKTIEEQKRILKPLLKIDKTIKKETAELLKQKSLKTGLMQDLLSGKVRIKNTHS